MKDVAVYKFCSSFRVSSHGVNGFQKKSKATLEKQGSEFSQTASTALLKVKTASVLPHLLAEQLKSAAENCSTVLFFFEIYL